MLSRSVLIIATNAADRLRYRQFIGSDYRYDEATTGAAAIDALQKDPPNCLVIAFDLPDMDCLTFLRQLKALAEAKDEQADHRLRRLPVIVIGAGDNAKIAVQALRSGAADYLVKHTLTGEDLQRSVQQALQAATQRRAIRFRRKQAEAALQRKYREELELSALVKTLNEISVELINVPTVNDFYRLVVQLGLERLGFERMGILAYDPVDKLIKGLYGTDAHGVVVDEHHLQFDPDGHGILGRARDSHERFVFDPETTLYADYNPIGVGWNAAAALWDDQLLGWLAADNGIRHQPITPAMLETIQMYSLTVGSLLVRKRFQARLLASEARYRLLAENIKDVIVTFSPDRVYTYVSPSMTNMLGFTPEEIVGHHGSELIHPDDQPVIRQEITEAMRSGLPLYENTCRMRHKDGHYLWIEMANTFIRDPITGAITEAISIARDITRRHNAQEALLKSEARLRSLIDSQTAFSVRTDLKGVITYANDRYRDYFGERASVGSSSLNHVVPEDRQTLLDAVRKCMADIGSPVSVELRKFAKDGRIVWTLVEFIIVPDSDGVVCEIQSMSFDITRQKQTEAALRDSEQRYRLLAENTSDVIEVLNRAFQVLFVTPSVQRLLGYTPEEFQGRSAMEDTHPDDRAASQHRANEAIRSGKPSYTDSRRIRRKDGFYIWVEVSNGLTYDPNTGDLLEITGVIRDITERKRAEMALMTALEKERDFSELKTRFISIASHEFRNPLATIRATADTLSMYRERMTPDQMELRLVKIRDQVDFMKAIMEDVLEQGRLQSSQVQVKLVYRDLNLLCAAIIEEFESIAANRGRIVFKPVIPMALVYFDERLMRQVITNLISNALKYSLAGKLVTVQITQNVQQTVLTVADSGIGIPPEDLKHLFEPFHRASNIGKVQGTGLGLTVTKQAIELQGGLISVESVLDEGTTFKIIQPNKQVIIP